jgi:hypothetical protein
MPVLGEKAAMSADTGEQYDLYRRLTAVIGSDRSAA